MYTYIIILVDLLINKLVSETRVLKFNLLIKTSFSVLIYILADCFNLYKAFNSFNM